MYDQKRPAVMEIVPPLAVGSSCTHAVTFAIYTSPTPRPRGHVRAQLSVNEALASTYRHGRNRRGDILYHVGRVTMLDPDTGQASIRSVPQKDIRVQTSTGSKKARARHDVARTIAMAPRAMYEQCSRSGRRSRSVHVP